MNELTTGTRIEKLCEENIDQLSILFLSVYGIRVSNDLFRQKYSSHYTGVSYMGYIAFSESKKPVAFCGAVPCFLSDNGKRVLAAQFADGMVGTSYQNKRLFTQLAGMVISFCKENSIQFLFGFPNQSSLPIFVDRLDWQLTATMDCFLIPVKTLPLEKIASRIPVCKKIYNAYKNRILKKYINNDTTIPASVTADGYTGVERSEDYVQSKRYGDSALLSVKQAAVWMKARNGLIIGDMSVTANEFDDVIHELKRIAVKTGVSSISFHTCKGTELHTLFAKKYKPFASFAVICKNIGEALSSEIPRFTMADIDIF